MSINSIKQSFFIPKPTLTEKNLEDQSNKVFIITGGYSGVGYELASILYQKNGIVYIAGRSSSKGTESITNIKTAFPESTGRLEFLQLDLSDLSTIKASAEDFLSREDRLDVLTNNAGIGTPPAGSVDAQGHELQLGTNCLGHFLFTHCLLPLLEKTAASSASGASRVTWAGSVTTELYAPTGGVAFDKDGEPVISPNQKINYGQSKAGDVLLASEFARRFGEKGIISVAWNPGNLKTNLLRHMSWLERTFVTLFLYPAIFGAYTELYAGWSDDITMEKNGAYIVPWGQVGPLRHDIDKGLKTEEAGGSGTAKKFWEWCEKETKAFM